MGLWTSLALLALAVASTLSFPHLDSAYKIPIVGQGRRSQYYVLHSDGTYKYGYDTLGGTYEQAMAKTPGHLTGEFGYKDPTGADVKLEYTADDRGFIAKGSHLPVAPDVMFGAKLPTAHEYASPAITHAAPSVYKAPEPAPQPAGDAAPSVYEVAQVESSSADDGSYSFSYKTSDSSRSESGDANNEVKGTYSYVTDDGVDRRIEYAAGAAGYIAMGDSLPIGPSVPGAESGIPTGHILPVLSEEEANALAGATHTAGVGEPLVATYSADGSSSDASYSFNYDAGDSSRFESADSDLNIKGSYSFVPPDLNQRLTVNYIAGSETGFVAEGDHLPKVADADFGTKLTGVPQPVSPVYVVSASAASPESPAGSVQTYSVGDSASDASYSFSYDTGDSSRSESADSNLNVKGSYSFVAPDSSHRFNVKYVAGAATGFVAEGDHLPVAPDATVAAELPTAYESASPAITHAAPSVYKAPEPAPQPAGDAAPSVYEVAQVESSSADDGSYSFSYKTSDSSRSESGDANNEVKGTYSYVTDDGVDRRIEYAAGAAGYIAMGDSLPIGPSVPGAESGIPTGHILPVLSEEEANALAGATHTAGVGEPLVATYSADGSSSDASYSFNYDAGDSSRSESADSNLNIKGSYSFVAPDSSHRFNVKYVAGAATGFVAEGDHLPVAPDATVAAKLPTAHESASPAITHTVHSVYKAPEVSEPAAVPAAIETVKVQSAHQPAGYSSKVVGDVLLHQYGVAYPDKYGYVFTAL